MQPLKTGMKVTQIQQKQPQPEKEHTQSRRCGDTGSEGLPSSPRNLHAVSTANQRGPSGVRDKGAFPAATQNKGAQGEDEVQLQR